MKITRRSPRTGKENTLELDVKPEQFMAYMRGTLIQDAFPNLTAAEREFIKTGYTQEDWDAIFPPQKKTSK